MQNSCEVRSGPHTSPRWRRLDRGSDGPAADASLSDTCSDMLLLFSRLVAASASPSSNLSNPPHISHFHIGHAHFTFQSYYAIVLEIQTGERFCPDDGLRKTKMPFLVAFVMVFPVCAWPPGAPTTPLPRT